MDQLLKADKYNYLRKYIYIFTHFLMHTVFHNKTVIRKRKKEGRMVTSVWQIMVHTPSSMTCEYLGKSCSHFRLIGPTSQDIVRIKWGNPHKALSVVPCTELTKIYSWLLSLWMFTLCNSQPCCIPCNSTSLYYIMLSCTIGKSRVSLMGSWRGGVQLRLSGPRVWPSASGKR